MKGDPRSLQVVPTKSGLKVSLPLHSNILHIDREIHHLANECAPAISRITTESNVDSGRSPEDIVDYPKTAEVYLISHALI